MDFKPLELNDKEVFKSYLSKNPPTTSELTFTNLFMWRNRYSPSWTEWRETLLVTMRDENGEIFGLPPVGTGDKTQALRQLTAYLGTVSPRAKIARAGSDLLALADENSFEIIIDRNNFDYVYLAEHLIKLPGNKFHRKKNHVNRFTKNHEFQYSNLDEKLVNDCMELQEAWCVLRDCANNPSLSDEDRAVFEALSNFRALEIKGGAIIIDTRVAAFAFGEMLNPETAVIHVEKADPDIPGLYAAMNQQFCAHEWDNAKYVNREQDLGVEGLRKAKMSYYPDHLVEKYIFLAK